MSSCGPSPRGRRPRCGRRSSAPCSRRPTRSIDGFGVTDTTWATLSSSFEPAQLFELLFVIGGLPLPGRGAQQHRTAWRPPGGAVKAVRSQDGGAALVDVDEPPGIGEVLDMRATSVCASDLSYIRYGSTNILGHELAGLREDGTPVVVEAIYGCLECDQCRRGAYNLCPTHGSRALGMFADGGMAEQFRAPPERLVPLPDGLELRDASVVEPASVSWHALRLAETWAGTTGGRGRGRRAWGCLAVAAARAQGGEDVALEALTPPPTRRRVSASARASARRGATTSSSRLPAPRRAWPAAASWWRRAAPSWSSASTSAPCSWTGCRCSTARPGSSHRWGTASTTACARWKRPPPCWPGTPKSCARSLRTASVWRMRPRPSAWPRTAAPAPYVFVLEPG